MFKKLSHILTAFFISCSHAGFIFSGHGNYLLCRNPYEPHRPLIRYTPRLHIREAAYFLYQELPHIPQLLQQEYIFPS